MTSPVQESRQDDGHIRAAMALNYCAVSISTILDYSDTVVLDQEYQAILNNVNIQEMVKDDDLLHLFQRMLDTLVALKMQQGDRAWVQREYENKLKHAIYDCMPQFNLVLAGGNPWTAVIGAVHQVGVCYMNYRRNINQYHEGRDKALWEIEKGTINQLHQLRKEWFTASWKLSDAYNIPEEWRLTQNQIDMYQAVLRDPEQQRAYDRLCYMSDEFMGYPPFSYYKARTALALAAEFATQGKKTSAERLRLEARMAYDQFDANWRPILRSDTFASLAALDRVSMLDPRSDVADIRKLLARVRKYAKHDYDLIQLAAVHYLSIDDSATAESLLRVLLNEGRSVEANGFLLSRMYRDSKRFSDYENLRHRIGVENVIDVDESLMEVGAESQLTKAATALARALAAAVTTKSRNAISSLQKSTEESLETRLGFLQHAEHIKWIQEGTNSATDAIVQSPLFAAYAAQGEDCSARVGKCADALKSVVNSLTEPFLREVAEAEAAANLVVGKKTSVTGAGAATIAFGLPGLAGYGIYKFFSKINAECNFDSECNDTPKALDSLIESIATSATPVIQEVLVEMARLYERKGDTQRSGSLLAFLQEKALEPVPDVASQKESWDALKPCPRCGKAQPVGRKQCGECGGEL